MSDRNITRRPPKSKGRFHDWENWVIFQVTVIIAAVSVFLVQNGSKVLGNPDSQWIFWVAPTLAGVFYNNFKVGRYRRKYEGTPGE